MPPAPRRRRIWYGPKCSGRRVGSAAAPGGVGITGLQREAPARLKRASLVYQPVRPGGRGFPGPGKPAPPAETARRMHPVAPPAARVRGEPAVEYRQLGGSGLMVPALSFGTGTF